MVKRLFPEGQINYSGGTGTSYFYTFDHLGSIREVLNSTGSTIVARYDYDPNGNVTLVQGTNLADFQFCGYYEHQASGLNLTMFRAYDPTSARWLSRDPIAESGGINLYQYGGNDPVLNCDDFGLRPRGSTGGWNPYQYQLLTAGWEGLEYNSTNLSDLANSLFIASGSTALAAGICTASPAPGPQAAVPFLVVTSAVLAIDGGVVGILANHAPAPQKPANK